MKRIVFFISDRTGITAEMLGHSLLSQFENVEFEYVILPFIDTHEKAVQVVQQINDICDRDEQRPIVFDTVVDEDIRRTILQSRGFAMDFYSTFLDPLEKELGVESSYSVGKTHGIQNQAAYQLRIKAVDYALKNDDGANTRNYGKADLILIGVSRCGKTPTSLYLALQFGLKVANYPFTEDNREEYGLPECLKKHKNRLFGLTIDPTRLQAIRNKRRPDSTYSQKSQCQREIQEIEAMYRHEGIPSLNTTSLSVEEIATTILAQTGLRRQLI